MDCRICLLLAFGKNKSGAVAAAVEGPLTAMVPASVLQLHPRAIFVLDEDAASLLTRTDYYKWVYENKPDWQKY
jgi:glucosamine-6-phosphate deaminase